MEATDLKYHQELALIHNCPPAELECRQCEAFRFVFDDRSDYRNVSPPAKINPRRTFKNDREKCDAHALSLFVSLETAVAFYRKRSDRHKKFTKTIGTHVARLPLATADGLCSQPNNGGHFNLFQADASDIKDRLEIVETLQ